MPSACTKPDNKASVEATETVKQCITLVEKKVRNLEKRKGKLDDYKEKLKEGATLEKEQKEAVARYDGVLQALEVAKELQKTFQSLGADIEKAARKQAKRDKMERQQQEVSRTRELLWLQNMLDNMGVETVREDFKNGTRGAIALTEENLSQLDELYKLISPSREAEDSFNEQLNKASEHIVGFLEGREKEVAGTTYKALRDLVIQIQDCGYFDNLPTETAQAEDETEAPVTEEAADEPEPETESAQIPSTESFEFVSQPEEISATSDTFQQQQEVPVPEPEPVHEEEEPQQMLSHAHPQPQTQPHGAFPTQDDSFFSTVSGFTASTQSGQARGQRPFNEIVSSVQGNFNFLQDSQLEMVETSGHSIDPAVVAVHPMVSQTDAGIPPQGNVYQSSSLLASEQSNSPFQPDQSQQSLATEAAVVAAAAAASQSQSSLYSNQAFNTEQNTSSSLDGVPYSSEQTFSQGLLDSASTQQHSMSFSSDPVSQASSYSHSMEQTVGISSSAGDAGGPQPIPLPNQTVPGQSIAAAQNFVTAADTQSFGATGNSGGYSADTDSQQYGGADTAQGYSNNQGFDAQGYGPDGQGMSADGQDKKPFTMNPNANIFRSMYNQQSGGNAGMGASGASQGSNQYQQGSSSYGSQDRKPYSQQAMQGDVYSQGSGNYSSGGGYTNNRSNYGGQRSGSGPPQRGGRGGRGGPGGGSGMNNGYSRGGPRGGSSYGGGNRSTGGGSSGYTNGRGNGGRGGGSLYQGYPPRNDYHPEGGYQGYTSSTSSTSSYTSASTAAPNPAPSSANTGGYNGAGLSALSGGVPPKRGMGVPPRGAPRVAPGMRSGPPPRGGSGGGMRGSGGRGGSSYGRSNNMQPSSNMNM